MELWAPFKNGDCAIAIGNGNQNYYNLILLATNGDGAMKWQLKGTNGGLGVFAANRC
jgi:hypothetical protein